MSTYRILFYESNSQPVEYDGKMIQKKDLLPIAYGDKIRLTVEKAHETVKVGISLRMIGYFDYEGWPGGRREFESLVPVEKGSVIDMSLYPYKPSRRKYPYYYPDFGQLAIEFASSDGEDGFFNVFRNSAMHVEENDSMRRYYCIDEHASQKFDTLIFTIEKLIQ